VDHRTDPYVEEINISIFSPTVTPVLRGQSNQSLIQITEMFGETLHCLQCNWCIKCLVCMVQSLRVILTKLLVNYA